MDENEKILALFTTRMRQMILRFQEMKQEREHLYAELKERDAQMTTLHSQAY